MGLEAYNIYILSIFKSRTVDIGLRAMDRNAKRNNGKFNYDIIVDDGKGASETVK